MATDGPDTVRTANADATRALGRALAEAALPLPPSGLVVALHGDLGAGKTVFVKGVAEGLGVSGEGHVVSPTFTIARSYPARDGTVLHHLDAYRLGSGEELDDIGFEDMCGSGCFTCVEWAERVTDALPEDRIDVWLELEAPEHTVLPGELPEAPRRVVLRARGPVAARVLDRLGDTWRERP